MSYYGQIVALTPHRWTLREPFVISRQQITEVETVEVVVRGVGEGTIGRGAAAGLDYAGETTASMISQLEAVAEIRQDLDRHRLLALLPAGGARNALDSALWDLEAKRAGTSAFTLAGTTPAPVISTTTLSLRAPTEMECAARRAAESMWLKLKVGDHQVVETVAAARRGSPQARLMVDPNQAWDLEALNRYAGPLAAFGVELIEQPLAIGREEDLDGYTGAIPLCADESCDGEADLPKLAGRFQAINIKLDKVGGLTAALALADAAEAQGFSLMVGCMLASSLTIAPSMVLAQRCSWIDLDAPPFLTRDDSPGFRFENGCVTEPWLPTLWG